MSSFDFFKNHLKIQAFQTLKTILASRHETGSRLCPTAAVSSSVACCTYVCLWKRDFNSFHNTNIYFQIRDVKYIEMD